MNTKMVFLRLKILLFFLFLFLKNSYAITDLKIGSFNIRNFNNSSIKTNHSTVTNLNILKEILIDTDADVLAIQEIQDQKLFQNFIDENFKNYKVVLSSCGGSASQYLGFLYNRKKLKLLKFIEDERLNIAGNCEVGLRPAVIGKFKNKLTDEEFLSIGVHLKAGPSEFSVLRREQQREVLTKVIKEYKLKGYDKIIVLGDFNTADYLTNSTIYTKFNRFVRGNKLYNFSNEIECSSYWSGEDYQDKYLESSLLDHILISEELLNRTNAPQIKVHSHCQKVTCQNNIHQSKLGQSYNLVSDHCPVVLTF